MAIGKSRAQRIRKNFRANYGPKPKITTSDVKGRRGAVKAGQSTYMKKDGTVGSLTRTQKLRTMKNLNKKAKVGSKIKPPTKLPSTGSGATKANPGKAAPLPQRPNLGNTVVGATMTPRTKMRGGGMMKAAAKKKMMRGGTVKPKTTKMAGGGMMKAAGKKKMMRGGMAKKKK